MKVTSARIGPYKSISTHQDVPIEDAVTVLVGQNEAGKSAVLEALFKTRPAVSGPKFSVIADYPRKNLSAYERENPNNDTDVVVLKFKLTAAEAKAASAAAGIQVPGGFAFSENYRYDGKSFVNFRLDEEEAVKAAVAGGGLIAETSAAAAGAKSFPELVAALGEMDLNDHETAFLSAQTARVEATAKAGWGATVASYEAYSAVKKYRPTFLYFGDYNILPGKANLPDLKRRKDANDLRQSDRSILALLRMANIDLGELLATKSYEASVARLEGVSNDLTDQVFKYWKQNEQLDVEIDIDQDPTDEPPFNNGPNLYIRIRNRRHRVTVPFDQRSRGFIWFFSFLVWFDDAQAQAEAKTPIFLLLDEPGLSLHGLAQADLLAYINDLSKAHQVVYTTHSPFMVRSDALETVRVVEDRDNVGTAVSDRLDSKDPKSIFPLQAALGYTIAQNLFIAERNLLVEGPADLLYLQSASSSLEEGGRQGLDASTVIVPVGGLDKVATFIALLFGNQLRMAVCVDKANVPDQRLKEMVVNKLIHDKALMDYGMFRKTGGTADDPTDVEDLFEVPHYLDMFNEAYKKELSGATIPERDLPAGTRIVERIGACLAQKGVSVRPSGGFNHFLVASNAVKNGLAFTSTELETFAELFRRVNAILA